jgi:hypothetical protein
VTRRAYEAIRAVVSDDNNYECGVACVRTVADVVVAEAGAAGLREMAVVLSVQLADALGRISAADGMTGVDIADMLFVA